MKELLNKKEPELEDLENSQAIHVVKNKKACSGLNTKDMTGQSLHKKIIQAAISAEASNSRDGIILAETLPVWTKEHREGMNFWTSGILPDEIVELGCEHALSFQKREE